MQNCRYTTPTTVRNVKGLHKINQFVEFNPFPEIPDTKKQTFLIFDFHPFFDGLIGYESLKNLKTDIITSTNELKFPSGKIQMKRKYPEVKSIYLNAHETKTVSLSINVAGDFYLDDDIRINSNVFIHSGLYSAGNGYTQVFITNQSSESCKIDLTNDILKPEINNFETGIPETSERDLHLKKKLFDQLRIDHLNADEKTIF